MFTIRKQNFTAASFSCRENEKSSRFVWLQYVGFNKWYSWDGGRVERGKNWEIMGEFWEKRPLAREGRRKINSLVGRKTSGKKRKTPFIGKFLRFNSFSTASHPPPVVIHQENANIAWKAEQQRVHLLGQRKGFRSGQIYDSNPLLRLIVFSSSKMGRENDGKGWKVAGESQCARGELVWEEKRALWKPMNLKTHLGRIRI